MSNDKKNIGLQAQIEEFRALDDADISEIYPGFSERLNLLIDQTDLFIPSLDSGRQSHISTLLNVSRMAPGDWLKKNRPPKSVTLRKLLMYLLKHIDVDISANKMEAWLKYGDDVVQNPFIFSHSERDALIPLATTLIVSVATEKGISKTSFDLSLVLSETIDTLIDFELTQEEKVEAVHRKIISQHILSARNP